MKLRLSRLSRREFLLATAGFSLGTLLATPTRTLSAPVEDRDLVWTWMFDQDGPPNSIGRRLLDNHLGICVKTHDGVSWMSEFDTSAYAVSGPGQVGVLAHYFEDAGIPFHAWAVIRGEDPMLEASMASDVLAAGARSIFLDMGADGDSWKGDEAAARQLAGNLRQLQPQARIVAVADSRPWLAQKVPVAALAESCDALAIQALWRSYAADGDEDAFAEAGHPVPEEGITPEFVFGAGSACHAGIALPKTWIADGSPEDGEEFRRFLDIARNAGSDLNSVWRYGTTSEAVFNVLGEEAVMTKAYVVQPGDSLSSIALGNAVSVDDIVRLNNLSDPNLIVEGQTLLLPGG